MARDHHFRFTVLDRYPAHGEASIIDRLPARAT
jgi:hypothetical protein